MASFTRNWDESTPTDSTNANEIDDYNRYLRVDCSDRLKDMVYGFTAGENDGVQGFKQVEFKQQAAAASQPNADEIVLYAIDDGSNCGLYAQNEDGYKTQLLKKIGSTFTIPSGAFGADAIDEDDIRLTNNEYLTGRNNADDGDINIIKVNASDVPELLVGAVLSADTAPTSDAAVANKKYVDDEAATRLTASGATVFNTTMTAATTFQDLDLSGTVGSNSALVFLEVLVPDAAAAGQEYIAKTKGYGSATWADHVADGRQQGGAVIETEGFALYGYITLMTDGSGVIQHGFTSDSVTITVKLIGYMT